MENAKSIYDPICEDALEFLRILYGTTLTEKPKEREERLPEHDWSAKDYAWTFVGMTDGPKSKELQRSVGIRSYRTLWKYLYDDSAIYITPNQYISRFKRTEVTLEWMNAIVVDFDDTQDVVCAFERMKLPGRLAPMLVNKTLKGLHFWYVFDKPVKATKGNQGRYKTIARAMAITAGADQQCQSPTQFFRIPRSIELFLPNEKVNFDKMYQWAKKVLKKHREKVNYNTIGTPEQLLNSEAFNTVLQGISKGGRNTAAYSLAMVYRNANVSKSEAINTMVDWNSKNDPPLSEKEIRDVVECVYKRNADKRLPINNIKLLSGKSFKFGRIITQKKDRSKRDRTHYSEWLGDLLAFIKKCPEQRWEGSQKALASETTIPLRSLKEVILMIKEGCTELQMRVVGVGCKAKTILYCPVPQNESEEDQNIESVPQKTNFVPRVIAKSEDLSDVVVQNQGIIPKNEYKKRIKIKFVPQDTKSVPQMTAKCEDSSDFVVQNQGRGENKMKIATHVEIKGFELVRSRNKGTTAGGWFKHPRRGIPLGQGVVVCRTQWELSPQPLPLKNLAVVACGPTGACGMQAQRDSVHKPSSPQEISALVLKKSTRSSQEV